MGFYVSISVVVSAEQKLKEKGYYSLYQKGYNNKRDTYILVSSCSWLIAWKGGICNLSYKYKEKTWGGKRQNLYMMCPCVVSENIKPQLWLKTSLKSTHCYIDPAIMSYLEGLYHVISVRLLKIVGHFRWFVHKPPANSKPRPGHGGWSVICERYLWRKSSTIYLKQTKKHKSSQTK